MVALWRAWADAWETTWTEPDEWEIVRREISRKMPATHRNRWMPDNRAVRSMFPTLFNIGKYGKQPFYLPQCELPALLRDPGTVFTDMDVTPDQHARILTVTKAQRERIVRACQFRMALVDACEGRELGITDPPEHLLKVATELTYRYQDLDHATIQDVLEPIANAPSIPRLNQFLSDSNVEDAVRGVVKDAWAKRPVALSGGSGLLSDAITANIGDHAPFEATDPTTDLWAFLGWHTDAQGVARGWNHPTAPVHETSLEDRWTAALAVEVTDWEPWAQRVGLLKHPPAVEPKVRSNAPYTESRLEAWLESPIETRLQPVLRDDVARRADLPDIPTMVNDAALRSAEPLALGTHEAQIMLLLGSLISQEMRVAETWEDEKAAIKAKQQMGVSDGTLSAAGGHARAHMRRWLKEQDQARGKAGIPWVWASAFADPTPYYIEFLWQRLNHHETYRRPSRSGSEAYAALTGIAHTLTDRLKGLSVDQVRLFLTPLFHTNDDGEDTEHVELPPRQDADARTTGLLLEIIRLQNQIDAGEWSPFWAAVLTRELDDHTLARWRVWTDTYDSDLELGDVIDWMRTNVE